MMMYLMLYDNYDTVVLEWCKPRYIYLYHPYGRMTEWVPFKCLRIGSHLQKSTSAKNGWNIPRDVVPIADMASTCFKQWRLNHFKLCLCLFAIQGFFKKLSLGHTNFSPLAEFASFRSENMIFTKLWLYILLIKTYSEIKKS